jgi:hydroxymethylbilane synthase
MSLKIATRKSKLAQIQADIVIEMLKAQRLESEKLLIETEGDRRLEVSLDKIGGKGLFVKDIEIALIEKRADAAVHSMKDVPYEIGSIFEIAAMPVREDVRDAFISAGGLSLMELPKGARIGTSSNRRGAQLKLLRPDIEAVPIRGNVQTRIEKMYKEGMEGIILAAAGLKRLGLEGLIKEYFEPENFVPAVGQGALGIEILKDSDNAESFKKLDSNDTRLTVEAERSFMRVLNGGCHTALGAYARLEGELMHIIGTFMINDKLVKKDITGSKWEHLKLGEELAKKILNCR